MSYYNYPKSWPQILPDYIRSEFVEEDEEGLYESVANLLYIQKEDGAHELVNSYLNLTKYLSLHDNLLFKDDGKLIFTDTDNITPLITVSNTHIGNNGVISTR